MPCHDITDTLRIRLDVTGRVRDYSLRKRTCGGAVGAEEMIAKWLTGRRAMEVLDTRLDVFLSHLDATSDLEEFMALKHFLIVQSALAVIFGQKSGTLKDHCTIERIEHDPEGTEMTAHLDSDAVVAEIRACGQCPGGGSTFEV